MVLAKYVGYISPEDVAKLAKVKELWVSKSKSKKGTIYSHIITKLKDSSAYGSYVVSPAKSEYNKYVNPSYEDISKALIKFDAKISRSYDYFKDGVTKSYVELDTFDIGVEQKKDKIDELRFTIGATGHKVLTGYNALTKAIMLITGDKRLPVYIDGSKGDYLEGSPIDVFKVGMGNYLKPSLIADGIRAGVLAYYAHLNGDYTIRDMILDAFNSNIMAFISPFLSDNYTASITMSWDSDRNAIKLEAIIDIGIYKRAPKLNVIKYVERDGYDYITAIDFTSDDSYIIISNFYYTYIAKLNIPELDEIASVYDPDYIGSDNIDISPDDKYVAVSYFDDNRIDLFDASDLSLIYTNRDTSYQYVYDIEFTHDSKYLVVGGCCDNKVIIYNIPDFSVVSSISLGDDTSPMSLAFSPNDEYLVVGTPYQASINLYTFPDLELINTFSMENIIGDEYLYAGVQKVKFTPDGEHICFMLYEDQIFGVMNIPDLEIVSLVNDSQYRYVFDIDIHPSGMYLSVIGGGAKITILSLPELQYIRSKTDWGIDPNTGEKYYPRYESFSNNGKYLVVSVFPRRVYLLE